MKINRLWLILPILTVLFCIQCKKDKPLPEQHYGEAIEATREYFPMHELSGFTTSPSVSPDGKYIAYMVAGTISNEKQGIWIADLHTGHKYMLRKYALSPSWRGDSKQLCFISGDLCISDLTGVHVEKLTQGTRCLYPDWHPTKNKIAYNGSMPGAYTINVMDIPNKTIVQQVAANGVGVNAGGWVGNTDSIVTQIDKTYKMVNTLSGEVVSEIQAAQLTNAQIISYPSISPDGKKIAFRADNAIYVININGTGLQRVVDGGARKKIGKPFKKGDIMVGDICWHPDGRHIIYQIIEFSNSEIASWGSIMGEGFSTLYKLNLEKALQSNNP